MAKVTNLKLELQNGTDSTYFASWSFNTTTKTSSSGIKAGDLVSIKSGATYYNGVSIPSWVMSDKWYVTQVKGDRAVLGKNQSGTHNIQSPINTGNLTGGSGSAVSKNTLDHYEVKWYYATGDGIWFSGSSSDVEVTNATYSGPSNATKIKVTVKPVSKTRKVDDKETSYWTGTSVSKTLLVSENPPEKPATPTVEIEKYKLTASLENISDPRSDQIEFQVYNGTKRVSKGVRSVVTCRASYTCTVSAGGDYRVRCRAINLNGNAKVYGEYSDYSNSISAIPAKPAKPTKCSATSETSVYLEWPKCTTAEKYDIEYTTETRYFDGSSETTTVSDIEFTHYEITGLESGQEYFFRIRSKNDQGTSAWSDIVSTVIGEDPIAPTTWSSTTTVITGEDLTLYWVHNSEDGSSQTFAELEITIGGVTETHTIENSTDEDEKDKTSSYVIDTSPYTEGTTIQWRVRTAGVTLTYGDWSTQRTIDVYAPPTLALDVTDQNGDIIETLTSFPFFVSGLAGPNTQAPIGYHLSITANESYETIDQIGNAKTVNANDEVYSKYFDTSDALLVEMSANNIDLENGIEYTVTCTVSMNSGLTTVANTAFAVSWTDETYEPDAEVSIDTETLSAYIRPYCRDEDGALIEGISLAVYRREFDGTFTEIGSDMDNTLNTAVTDPHPSLDYARYRIVATTKSTGAVSFYDLPGYLVNEHAVIIQWDEVWSNFDVNNEDAMEQPPWTGSMLKLPYDIDVSDSYKPDTKLVEYIGRSHPTSYYGTQLGSTSTWNVVIPKNDEETLYAIRRLAIWMGDVYVREPSGSGYWANIVVSYNQTHDALTIPITFDITRVEGGM